MSSLSRFVTADSPPEPRPSSHRDDIGLNRERRPHLRAARQASCHKLWGSHRACCDVNPTRQSASSARRPTRRKRFNSARFALPVRQDID
ncbi:hypothetical protein TgHK011_005433 [Trichoderma gracile]|nr:hypothetical protein TgHK011_005433 [Trichoderma gracile]